MSCIVLLALLGLSTPVAKADDDTPPPPAPPRTVLDPVFVDIGADEPFASDIRSIFAEEITLGCNPPTNNQFCPERSVSRAELAAFLVRGLRLEPGTDLFEDTGGHPLEAEVAALAAAGITRGCNPPLNTRFCPDSPITRQQMAAFLDRALHLEPANGSSRFTDTTSSEFAAAIDRLATAGITRGCNPPANDRFCPDSPVNRGEMAAFLRRALSLPTTPAVPTGVTSELAEDVTDLKTEISRQVCDVATGGEVTVRNAGLGRSSIPTSVTTPSGSWVLDGDVWSFVLAEGECATLDLGWDATSVILTKPLSPVLLSSRFGNRLHPIAGVWRLHAGVDLKADTGTPILSAADGTVVKAGWYGGYGRMVDVAHPGGLITRYAHMSSIGVVEGATVSQGDVLGLVGCTGSCTGPHLHWETRVWDQPINPARLAGWLAYAAYDPTPDDNHPAEGDPTMVPNPQRSTG